MKTKISRFPALSLAAVALLAAPLSESFAQSATNLLVNGDFESEPNWGGGLSHDNGYTALTGSQVPGWTIEPNHAVTIHIAPGPYLVISGAFSANTDGEGWNGHNANFYQDFASTAGMIYRLFFRWQSWGYIETPTADPVEVSVTDTVAGGELYSHSCYYDGAGEHPVRWVEGYFRGTGNAVRLRIQETPEPGYNDNSFVVDDFTIRTQSFFVNEPSFLPGTTNSGSFAFSFPTVTNMNYTVEFKDDLNMTDWQFLKTITGNGSLMQCVVPMTNSAQRFFRVRQP